MSDVKTSATPTQGLQNSKPSTFDDKVPTESREVLAGLTALGEDTIARQQPKKYPYQELNEIIDNAPGGKDPFSVITMAKAAAKGINTIGGFMTGAQNIGQNELIAATTDVATSITGTNFARVAAAGGVKAARGGISMFGSYVDDLAEPTLQNAFEKRKVIAEAMEKQEVPREEIFRQTGLFRGFSDEWNFEIADNAAKISKLVTLAADNGFKKEANLDQLLKHEDLYKVYPKLRDARVIFDNDPMNINRGSFDPDIGDIKLNLAHFKGDYGLPDFDAIKSTLLHEIQHKVQQESNLRDIKKGGVGSSPTVSLKVPLKVIKDFRGQYTGESVADIKKRLLDAGLDEIEAQLFEHTMASAARTYKFVSSYLKRAHNVDLDKVFREADTYGLNPEEAVESVLRKKNVPEEDIDFTMKDLQYQQYANDAGEVESRLTQAREKMTKGERRKEFPEEITKSNKNLTNMGALWEYYEP